MTVSLGTLANDTWSAKHPMPNLRERMEW